MASKTWKKNGNTYKTKTTTYSMTHSPGIRKTIIEKITCRPRRDSPTKRMIDHKNAAVKHKTNAAKVSGSHEKMLYTLDPKNAYLVSNNFPNGLSSNEIIEKTMNNRRGFTEKCLDQDGAIVTTYYYSSPQAQKILKGGRVKDSTRKFEVSNKEYVDAQEFFKSSRIDNIISENNLESRKDFMKRMEERTQQLDEEIKKDANLRIPSEKYHHILRSSLSKY